MGIARCLVVQRNRSAKWVKDGSHLAAR